MTLLNCFLTPPAVPRTGILRTAMPHIIPSTSRPAIPFSFSHRRLYPRVHSTTPISATASQSVYSQKPEMHSSTPPTMNESSSRYAPGPNDDLLPLPEALSKDNEMATRYDPQVVEQELYMWWEKSGLFKPCSPNGREAFTICMPPPNVTGVLHMGHAMFATLQDILTRFHRMRGHPTLWLPGTDHAGIATQLVVEKALKAEGTSRIEMGREEFLKQVWKWKDEKGGYITQQMRRLGSSCDWDREKFTLQPDMSEAVVHAFKKLYDAGLIYKGDYMVNWSPNLGTAVSDLEVEFAEENGKLYFFKYPLASSEDGSDFLPIATTRPETILGDTAVCVHPEDERYKHLIGSKAKVPILGREIPIIADEYVDIEFGTGALKITPGHDHNDYELGKKHSLRMINILNRDATINENGGQFEGLDRFEARTQLWKVMEEHGLTIKVEDHVNRVPRSQRGGEVIEPLVSTQWFIKMEGLAKDALDAVKDKKVTIVPQRFEKVYFNWLEDIRDWCISRQLWWGHRIPVWYVDGKSDDDFIVASNEQEAYEIAAEKYKGQTVTLTQETDVLDTWFSSGLWPFSTMGWPNKKSEDFQTFFPGSVLETGYDILFFWVARMIMLSLWFTGKVPFETVYLHGLVRDKDNRKMSKSLGNVIDPIDTIEQYGTDALRYTLVTGSTPGQDIPLSNEKVEANRNFANKLWNATRFIIGNLDGIDESERKVLAQIAITGLDTYYSTAEESDNSLPLPERFIVSRLHALVASVGSGLEMLSFGDAGRLIQEFLWDEFADWYVEIAKTRLTSDDADAQRRTRATLVYVMDTCLRLLHPFMPFVTEALWHRFPRDGSTERALISAAWPSGGLVDHDAIRRFERLQALVGRIRNARAEYQVQPGKRIPLTVRASDPVAARDIEAESGMLFLLTKVDPEQFSVVHEADSEPTTAASEGEEDDGALRLIVADGIEAVIPLSSMIDYEKETRRLGKQIAKVQKDLDGLNKRLNAPGFEDKAPPVVVQQTKSSAEELTVQLSSLNKRLADVEKMASSN